jgi:hypothetical protein
LMSTFYAVLTSARSAAMPLRQRPARRRRFDREIAGPPVGKDKQTATNTLQNAGFTVQVLEVPTSTSFQSGKVLDEQPAGGTDAPDGSSVTIYVGSG